MKERTFLSADEMYRAAADRFVEIAAESVREQGRFVVALSGGSTPIGLYRELRSRPVDWPRVWVFWSDERMVPPDHPESNEGLARRELLDHVPVSEDRVFGMARGLDSGESAEFYEQTIQMVGGTFDLLLLGMGADGHTASLFPADPAREDMSRSVLSTTSPSGVRERVSLGFSTILASRAIMLLITGGDKAAVWQQARDDSDFPVQRLLEADQKLEVFLSP